MPCVWTKSGHDRADEGDLLITVNGEILLLDPCGAAFVPAHSVLLFADLHFEKGSFYARGRQFLPPYDTTNTLLRMARAVARHKPARVVALGDSFHDGEAADRLQPEERGVVGVTAQDLRVGVVGRQFVNGSNGFHDRVAAADRVIAERPVDDHVFGEQTGQGVCVDAIAAGAVDAINEGFQRFAVQGEGVHRVAPFS